MYKFRSEQLFGFVTEIESYVSHVREIRERILCDNSWLNELKDARVTIFSKLINVSNTTQLALTMSDINLLDNKWWGKIFEKKYSSNEIKFFTDQFITHVKTSFIQFTFSAVESSIRMFLKAIDPTSCNNGTSEFKSIYETLIKNKLTTISTQSIILFDLWRLTRNTIHNNGVYFHRSNVSESITYNGKSYQFEIGMPIKFVTWEFIMEISNELLFLVESIVLDPLIISLKMEITDPFSNYHN